jgi:hypothetical protein
LVSSVQFHYLIKNFEHYLLKLRFQLWTVHVTILTGNGRTVHTGLSLSGWQKPEEFTKEFDFVLI